MKIIGISGKCQSGKDTIFDMFVKEFYTNAEYFQPDLFQHCFADYLRNIVYNLFCDQDEIFNSEKLKLQEVKAMTAPCGKTIREILQLVGTEKMRSIDPECWIRAYTRGLEAFEEKDVVITTDVRFPNELKCIQDLGGKVIRLTRNPLDLQHESETALDGHAIATIFAHSRSETIELEKGVNLFDKVIHNDSMTIEEQYEAFKNILRNWKVI